MPLGAEQDVSVTIQPREPGVYALSPYPFAADAADNLQPRLHSLLLSERSAAVGKSLDQIDLRGRVEITGVRRRGARSERPQADYRFEAGDVLVLLGRPADIMLAEKTLLRG